MRITICGHAALLIETNDQRLLVDPVFADTLVDGALAYHPARAFELGKLPEPTGLVVTHGHFDHFHPESLDALSRDLPVVCADDADLIEALRGLGFRAIRPCRPWQTTELGRTRLVATPSAHEEPEFGLLVRDETGSFWHMADAEVDPEVGHRIVREYGRVDAVSVKYQPVVRASMGYQRGRGTAFDKREVLGWLEAACACDPGFAFPYASGLCFAGRHAWFNRYAFPLTAEEAAALLRDRFGSDARAAALRPGDVLAIEPDAPPRRHEQAAAFVRCVDSGSVDWEPVDLTTLAGVESAEERAWLERELSTFLEGPLSSWLQRSVDAGGGLCAHYRSAAVVWQLAVHVAAGERWTYHVDFRGADVRPRPGPHPNANFFTHVSGLAVYEVLLKRKPGAIFWLTGDVRSYEKIMRASPSGFAYAEPAAGAEDDLADPFVYYLRYFGTGEASPHEPERPAIVPAPSAAPAEPGDLEVLAREGENRKVLFKKILLAHLAAEDLRRLDMEPTLAEVQEVADRFRRELELLREADMRQWLDDAGLGLDGFGRVMRDFATVLKAERHYQAALAARSDDHRRVIAGRNRRLFGPFRE